jgi:hypothetical protein
MRGTRSSRSPPQQRRMAAQKILAYFSHSYRAEDREVNQFFWNLFSDAGYFFTVDPQSKLFSIPYLESMMLLSNCFVAVIPRRAGTPTGCSPYILFEYGLSVQAQKPALVFVEQGLSSAWFPRDAERIVTFNRQRLADQRAEFKRAIQKLARKVRGERNPDLRLRQPCGLVIQSDEGTQQVYTPALVQTLSHELRKYGRTMEAMRLDFDAAFQFSLELDKFDVLVMEVRDSLQSPWLAGYVLGRAVPTIKVCHLAQGETPESVALPAIIAKHKPEPTTETPVEFWRDTSDLLQRVTTHVSKFNTDRIEFHTKDAGNRYFSRAGRREAKVFISNAGVSNPLANKLITELRLESIDFFHYQVKDSIPVGERWLEELERQIEQSSIFVALLTADYLQSRWCLFELQVARRRAIEGKLKIHPYAMDASMWPVLTVLGLDAFQVQDCTSTEPAEIVSGLVKDLDRELRAGAPAPSVAIIHDHAATSEFVLTEDERRTLVRILTNRLTPQESRAAWVKSLLIHALLYAPLAGEDYSGSAETIAGSLVTKAEALGVLADGERGITRLVASLCEEGRVSQAELPFLTGLAGRLKEAGTDPGTT